MKQEITENIKIAFDSVRSQVLRTILTSLIIAIGIMALVGILTSIDALKESLTGQFALLGANTYSISNTSGLQIGRRGRSAKYYDAINFRQAKEFKDESVINGKICSLNAIVSSSSQLKTEKYKSDPNVTVFASDENYLITAGYEIEDGRAFTSKDIDGNRSLMIIGQEVRDKLFPNSDPIGKTIVLQGMRFKVVGLIKEKGSSFGLGGDRSVFIPLSTARSLFTGRDINFNINIKESNSLNLDQSISESTVLMRKIRRLNPKQDNNFSIMRSDNLSEILLDNLSLVSAMAVIIGLITLLGASIALMNIMLVSVTERTREIGIRKAVGAKAVSIRNQFLTEAILICLLGGIGGIIFGIAIGNIIGLLVGSGFIIPWVWMLLAAVLCLLAGLSAGYYPAQKASRLDPIESLRYE